MKKLIGTVAVAALLASAAFAEVSFSAWLNNLSAVVAGDGDEIRAGVANPWGGWRAARIGFGYTSDEEKVDMKIGLSWEAGSVSLFSSAYMAVKPWDWLRVSVGNFDDNDTGLRSDLSTPSWNWLRTNYLSTGEGITFSDIAGKGLRLQLFPVDGLHIAALIPVSADFDVAKDVYNKTQVAVGYTIGDIGTIKLGWWGKSESGAAAKAKGWYDKDGKPVTLPSADDIEASDVIGGLEKGYTYLSEDSGAAAVKNEFDIAFDLTAIDGMFLTVGTKLTITDDSDNNNYLVALGWRYNFTDTFALFLDASAKFYGNSDNKPDIGAALAVNVGLTDALNLDAEVRYLHSGETAAKDAVNSISFLVGLNYAVSSNGVLGIGFEGITQGQGFCYGDVLAYSDAFAWAVPIKVSIWF